MTGHGCFSDYLYRIGREEFDLCFHCGADSDSAQHTLEVCGSWAIERAELCRIVGLNLSLPALIKAMLGREDCWKAVKSFASKVMLCKENAERIRRDAATVAAAI